MVSLDTKMEYYKDYIVKKDQLSYIQIIIGRNKDYLCNQYYLQTVLLRLNYIPYMILFYFYQNFH